jgi:hypothetical protein
MVRFSTYADNREFSWRSGAAAAPTAAEYRKNFR